MNAAEILWATCKSNTWIHVLDKTRVATNQEALCGEIPPYGCLWSRADANQHWSLRKCRVCVRQMDSEWRRSDTTPGAVCFSLRRDAGLVIAGELASERTDDVV